MTPTAFARRLALALALLPAAAAAQPESGALPAQLEVDYATFLYDDEETLVEVYLAVDAPTLAYTAGDEGFVADLPLHLALRPTAQNAPEGARTAPVWEQAFSFRYVVADTAGFQEGQFFAERVRTAVAPGEYDLDVVLPADTARGRSELRATITGVAVPDYSADDRATLSGVTLARGIRRSDDRDGAFFRNGLEVLPNPSGFFGEALPAVSFYAEAYGLPEALEAERYTLLSFLSGSANGAPLPGLQHRQERAARDPDVLVGSFDVSQLPSGAYYLRLVVLDARNESVVEQAKKLFVLNPGVAAPQVAADDDLETNRFRMMPTEELEEMLRQVRVLATNRELAQIGGLTTDDGRRAFLAAFWRARDEDNDPSHNEAYRAFQERLRYVEQYGAPGFEGYDTDRGRVVLKYGLPSEVDYHPFEQNLVPHEIWSYDNIPGQGQALFVFADREGLGRYDLLHSSVIGELSQVNWRELLTR